MGDGALWEPLLVCFSGFMAPAFSPFKEMLRGLIQFCFFLFSSFLFTFKSFLLTFIHREIDTDIKNTLPPPGIANETDLSGVKELPNDLVQRMTSTSFLFFFLMHFSFFDQPPSLVDKLVMLLFTFLFSDPSLIPFLFRIICHTIHTNHENSERAQREILACLNHFVFAPSFRALNEEMCLSSVVKNCMLFHFSFPLSSFSYLPFHSRFQGYPPQNQYSLQVTEVSVSLFIQEENILPFHSLTFTSFLVAKSPKGKVISLTLIVPLL